VRWSKVAGLVALAAVVFFMLGYWVSGFMAVDTCLDNGGRWVEEADACDLP
jgi:hypothetical protein